MGFTFRKESERCAALLADGEQLFSIDDLQLGELRFRRGGEAILGAAVRMPLYWRQYMKHQDPGRRLDSNAAMTVLPGDGDEFLLRVTGRHPAMDVRSAFHVHVRRCASDASYIITVDAALLASGDARWRVEHNPDHGELEFCALWPAESFRTDGGVKRYGACYTVRQGCAREIPHHHFLTPEKRNISLEAGDRLLWGVEEDNPHVELLEAPAVSAGVCAYMWDAHLACRFCSGEDRVMLPGFHAFARYRLSSLSREECLEAIRGAEPARPDGLRGIPVLAGGKARMLAPGQHAMETLQALWPWEYAGGGDASHAAEAEADGGVRFRIGHGSDGRGEWRYTCIGAAYGEAPMSSAETFTLTALVRCRGAHAKATLAMRYHREGRGDVFDAADYECAVSAPVTGANEGWTMLEARICGLEPAPDRMHCCLVLEGAGSAEWRDVRFTRGTAA